MRKPVYACRFAPQPAGYTVVCDGKGAHFACIPQKHALRQPRSAFSPPKGVDPSSEEALDGLLKLIRQVRSQNDHVKSSSLNPKK